MSSSIAPRLPTSSPSPSSIESEVGVLQGHRYASRLKLSGLPTARPRRIRPSLQPELDPKRRESPCPDAYRRAEAVIPPCRCVPTRQREKAPLKRRPAEGSDLKCPQSLAERCWVRRWRGRW